MNDAEKIAITKYDLFYESRMTRVESAVENLSIDVTEIKTDITAIKREMKTDFRWTLGIILGSNASLFALMSHGFKWW